MYTIYPDGIWYTWENILFLARNIYTPKLDYSKQTHMAYTAGCGGDKAHKQVSHELHVVNTSQYNHTISRIPLVNYEITRVRITQAGHVWVTPKGEYTTLSLENLKENLPLLKVR